MFEVEISTAFVDIDLDVILHYLVPSFLMQTTVLRPAVFHQKKLTDLQNNSDGKQLNKERFKYHTMIRKTTITMNKTRNLIAQYSQKIIVILYT